MEKNLKMLSQMGTDYLRISAADWGERVRLKDQAAGKMGNFVIDNNMPRDLISKEIISSKNEGLLIAMATAITLRPESGDTAKLLETGAMATRKHVRYRVLLAINSLNQQKLVSSEEKKMLIPLINSYRTNSDQSLINMIETTLSVLHS